MRRSSFLLALLPILPVLPVGARQSSEDDRIYDEVRLRLVRDPDVKGGALEVEVKDGVVTVKGTVKKESARQKVEKLAKRVKGVKSVVNQVEVRQFP